VRGFLRRVGKGDVTVNINSGGGDFFTGLAIYNMLREHDGAVHTNVLGLAASAASLIAMASDELRVAKAGFIMIHNAWAIALGNRHDMRAVADMLEQFDGAMAGVYTDRSGVALGSVKSYMDAETFFNGENAVDIGLADALLEADEVEPDEEPSTEAALRRIDLELARAGMPRSQRRDLINRMPGGTPGATSRHSGTPGATANATPGAGDELLATLRANLSIAQASEV
jgi:ATP-dependent protease ClpP protease subunit